MCPQAAGAAVTPEACPKHDGRLPFAGRPAFAHFAPVVTRYIIYDVAVEGACRTFADAVLGWDAMRDWMRDAEAKSEEIVELDIEF